MFRWTAGTPDGYVKGMTGMKLGISGPIRIKDPYSSGFNKWDHHSIPVSDLIFHVLFDCMLRYVAPNVTSCNPCVSLYKAYTQLQALQKCVALDSDVRITRSGCYLGNHIELIFMPPWALGFL